MKIAVTATGGSMSALVSEKFGRCQYFLVVDSETMKFEPVSNSGIDMAGGAGPAAAGQIADLGAKVILTGAVGPNAQRALEASGIKVVGGFTGDQTVREAVEKYIQKS
ncbi:MAG: NifB/NifX family molybdenum-iron cluster-binding protein [Elusimicrobiota bacterium]|nr:NifB/NifX family molybdenum-iron cluster-binding protein [Elusimicrobiota bacterium]